MDKGHRLLLYFLKMLPQKAQDRFRTITGVDGPAGVDEMAQIQHCRENCHRQRLQIAGR